MKQYLLAAVLFITCYNANAQVECVTEKKYTVQEGTTVKKYNDPIVFCYNRSYFSFTAPAIGTRTFEIDNYNKTVNKDGYVAESFFNAEDNTAARGDYWIYIVHGKTKEISIRETRAGMLCVIETKNPFYVKMSVDSSALPKQGPDLSARAYPKRNLDTALNNLIEWSYEERKNEFKCDIPVKMTVSEYGVINTEETELDIKCPLHEGSTLSDRIKDAMRNGMLFISAKNKKGKDIADTYETTLHLSAPPIVQPGRQR